MPKNIKGGKGAKKQKNTNSNEDDKIIFKDSEDQDYGKVEKLLGNCRVQLICNDKVKRLGIIRGSMRKKVWINLNSVVLYSKRPYEDDKVDIIHVYKNESLFDNSRKMNLTFSILNEEQKDDDIFFNNNSDESDDIDYDINHI
tara:strand:- start:632 stop:1060 length:429 start_codon:yes stop_codon:yes gene_type:complete